MFTLYRTVPDPLDKAGGRRGVAGGGWGLVSKNIFFGPSGLSFV